MPSLGAATSIALALLSLAGLMLFLTSPNTAGIVSAVFDGFNNSLKAATGR